MLSIADVESSLFRNSTEGENFSRRVGVMSRICARIVSQWTIRELRSRRSRYLYSFRRDLTFSRTAPSESLLERTSPISSRIESVSAVRSENRSLVRLRYSRNSSLSRLIASRVRSCSVRRRASSRFNRAISVSNSDSSAAKDTASAPRARRHVSRTRIFIELAFKCRPKESGLLRSRTEFRPQADK